MGHLSRLNTKATKYKELIAAFAVCLTIIGMVVSNSPSSSKPGVGGDPAMNNEQLKEVAKEAKKAEVRAQAKWLSLASAVEKREIEFEIERQALIKQQRADRRATRAVEQSLTAQIEELQAQAEQKEEAGKLGILKGQLASQKKMAACESAELLVGAISGIQTKINVLAAEAKENHDLREKMNSPEIDILTSKIYETNLAEVTKFGDRLKELETVLANKKKESK